MCTRAVFHEGLQHSAHDMCRCVQRVGIDIAASRPYAGRSEDSWSTDWSKAGFTRFPWRERLFGILQKPYCPRMCCLRDCGAHLASSTAPSRAKHCARHRLLLTHVQTQPAETDTRKGVGRIIRGCSTQSRATLFLMTKILGGLDSSVTMTANAESMEQLRLDDVGHLRRFAIQESEPTPTGAATHRSVTRRVWRRSHVHFRNEALVQQ